MSPAYHGCCGAMGMRACAKVCFCARCLVWISKRTIFISQLKFCCTRHSLILWLDPWYMETKIKQWAAWIGSYPHFSKKPISKRKVKNLELISFDPSKGSKKYQKIWQTHWDTINYVSVFWEALRCLFWFHFQVFLFQWLYNLFRIVWGA